MSLVLVRGAGDVGSAIAHALFRADYRVVVHDNPSPSHPRRGMSFADALFAERPQLEGVLGKRAGSLEDLRRMVQCHRAIPVADIDLHEIIRGLRPQILVDARMRKRETPDDQKGLAPLTIGLGPNFEAGVNADVVVETSWGDELGKVMVSGRTKDLAGEPQAIGGHRRERFVYSPVAGTFRTGFEIGDRVEAGWEVGRIGGTPLCAPLTGRLRGLTRDGVAVSKGAKVVEVDARDDPAAVRGLGERPNRVALGVLAAVKERLPEPAKTLYVRPRTIQAFGVGAGIGAAGGLIGLGGAEFRLPALVGHFGFAIKAAIAANILISFVTVVSALAFRLVSQGAEVLAAHWLPAAPLLLGSLISAYSGATVASRLNATALHRVVGALLALIGVVMLSHAVLHAHPGAFLDSPLLLFVTGTVAGVGIGLISSILGVAGGELLIPTFVLLYGLDAKIAGTIALAVSTPTLMVAILRYRSTPAFRATIQRREFLGAMGAGSIAGAYVGSLGAEVVASGILTTLLGLILIVSAYRVFRH